MERHERLAISANRLQLIQQRLLQVIRLGFAIIGTDDNTDMAKPGWLVHLRRDIEEPVPTGADATNEGSGQTDIPVEPEMHIGDHAGFAICIMPEQPGSGIGWQGEDSRIELLAIQADRSLLKLQLADALALVNADAKRDGSLGKRRNQCLLKRCIEPAEPGALTVRKAFTKHCREGGG